MQLELRSVRIKNCGPIDDIKLDFFDAAGRTLPVCVIGGANGSGKTTILEALFSLAESLIPSKTPILNAMGALADSLNPKPLSAFNFRLNAYVQTDWRFGKIEFSLFRGYPPSDVKLLPENLGRRFIPFGQGWYEEEQRTPGVEELQLRINQQLNGNHIFSATKSLPIDQAPSVIYLPHNRSLEPVSGEEIRKEEDRYQFVHRFQTVHEFPGSLNSYLIWLDYAVPEAYLQIQQFLNGLDFEGKIFRVDRKSLNVLVKTANGEEHPLHDLSSGEQNVLIILIELRRKLTPGSVVLIDEIENSLHPAFQHRLAQGLLKLQRDTPYQLIVTTHAPAFVEIFGAENTRLLTAF